MPQEYRMILKHVDQAGYTPDLECYVRHGGYQTLRKAVALKPVTTAEGKTESGPEQIRKEVMLSGLRGRGGAGFSCGLKWSFVDRKSGKPIYLICNADESEPGTFKDRQIIYKDPHQLIEGMIISSYANDVHLAFIYIRGEFAEGAKILNRALAEARAAGYLGQNILGSGYDLEIYVHRGAGAYICGEETGLIESLEGKRPYPRIKPPYFPAVLGLYQCPTIVNNVETLCAVKHIVEMGGAAYARLGTPNNTGTRIVSLSGHVRRPGYYEIEVGKVTLGELIFHENFGQGLRPGRTLKAVIPGGSSAKVFKAGEKITLRRKRPDGSTSVQEMDLLDLPYDFDTIAAAGSMSGSGAIIVMDDTADMVAALANLAEFYAHESCGQCTPCREGALWMSKILHRMDTGRGRAGDPAQLLHLAQNIQGRTVCAFGEACSWPVLSFVSKFREDFEARGGGPAPKNS
ncbi:NADH-quinone oxidoreductase subunit NuoF [Fontisphaera persica]|uniref:NADH-quinone oxidoreductase subunit NuoF n=1 Tax=Fontisphaera persica TaxID=2974023 RepID=UPI0024BF5540|nr:NADH-quinone oxidoreductase subunit NuoF [Fontisphaera persica]WCJ60568.1 NADH-quinone oxidoreductase subunit NuoF [Fontisphaera persica]